MGQESLARETFDLSTDAQSNTAQSRLISGIYDQKSQNDWRAVFAKNDQGQHNFEPKADATAEFYRRPNGEDSKPHVDVEFSKQFKELLQAIPEEDRAEYSKEWNEYMRETYKYIVTGQHGKKPHPGPVMEEYEELAKLYLHPTHMEDRFCL